MERIILDLRPRGLKFNSHQWNSCTPLSPLFYILLYIYVTLLYAKQNKWNKNNPYNDARVHICRAWKGSWEWKFWLSIEMSARAYSPQHSRPQLRPTLDIYLNQCFSRFNNAVVETNLIQYYYFLPKINRFNE